MQTVDQVMKCPGEITAKPITEVSTAFQCMLHFSEPIVLNSARILHLIPNDLGFFPFPLFRFTLST
jgi:hypothetical protein